MGILAKKACLGVIELGPTPLVVAELRSWAYDQQSSTIDVSTMGNCDTTELAGRITRTVEATLYLADPADPSQDLIVIGDTLAIVAYPFGKTAGKLSLTGNIEITARNESGDVDGAVELTFSATTPAELTRGVVP